MYRRIKKKRKKLITPALVWEITMRKHEGETLKSLAQKYKMDYYELSRILKTPQYYIER